MAINSRQQFTSSIGLTADRPAVPDGGVVGGSLFWEENGLSLSMAGRGAPATRSWINLVRTQQGFSLTGAVTVIPDNRVTANSRIFIQRRTQGPGPGFLSVAGIVPGVSFTITSSNVLDGSDIWYWIIG